MIGVLANQKGGVAKTTNTVHLGASLANRGYKVLLIDFDSQCDLSHNVGVDINDGSYNVEDLMEDRKSFAPVEKAENLFVVCGSIDFGSFKYKLPTLKKALNKDRNGNSIATFFDFVFIDCPPSKVVLERRNHSEIELALYASDFFLIPLKADDFSVKNANTFLGKASAFIEANDISIRFLGFFFGSILITENSLDHYSKLIRDNSTNLLFTSFIRQDAEVKKAVQLGKTIFQHNPKCRAADDYTNFTTEFLELIKN
jgi:chromosome partitioning protein